MVTVPYHTFVVAKDSQLECPLGNGGVAFQMKSLGCPKGKYGGLCQFDCVCKNGATCHIFNGACKCLPGWKGVACDEVNPSLELSPKTITVKYGDTYLFYCYAHHISLAAGDKDQPRFQWYINDIILDTLSQWIHVSEDSKVYNSYGTLAVIHVATNLTGKYECRVRDQTGIEYSDTGYAAISGCRNNKWGDECEINCDCLHADTCDRYAGCICSSGWKGRHCNEGVNWECCFDSIHLLQAK
ncbi:multiple epidermal growth factor-like domains protein 11 [Ptychodera flava]|uniref:multiple epidermal growth factor-like domains protein 11 n=1 Tax=Ptychodera flava TaxID=63121 RepID=UPI00396A02B6